MSNFTHIILSADFNFSTYLSNKRQIIHPPIWISQIEMDRYMEEVLQRMRDESAK